MPSHAPGFGPFSKRLYFPPGAIDRVCLEALQAVGCLPDTPGAVRIERFVEKRFECDLAYDTLEEGILGCIAFTPEGRVHRILLAESLEDGSLPNERRLRSTVAHECGHGLLHATLFVQSPETQESFGFEPRRDPPVRILCRGEDIGAQKGYDGKWWEYQANQAIGGLLLPRKLVAVAAADFLGADAAGLGSLLRIPGQLEALARQLADIFEVNPIVARIRIAEMWGSESDAGALI